MTVLIDTSAWIEFLRDTGSPACAEVDRLLARRIATTDPVVMEVLAGARNEAHLGELRRLVGRATMESVIAADYLAAAALFRRCRAHGTTVRKLIDCLIAAVAIRRDMPILHADADFDGLAKHTPLRVHLLT